MARLRHRRRRLVGFSERRPGSAAVAAIAWLLLLGIVVGTLLAASLLQLARHSGLDPAGPGPLAGALARWAWDLSG